MKIKSGPKIDVMIDSLFRGRYFFEAVSDWPMIGRPEMKYTHGSTRIDASDARRDNG